MLAVFCTDAINILAGVNGLESYNKNKHISIHIHIYIHIYIYTFTYTYIHSHIHILIHTGMLAVFCTNTINILAGVNGLESYK